MMESRFGKTGFRVLSAVCVLLLLTFPAGAPLAAQEPQQPPPPQAQLSPQQLDNLVAPVALYPDSLLSQVFVAATYPLELVEAGQWLQQNRNLQGMALVNAAQQQNWDPSVQALVVFPDVLNLLNSNIRWTTDLGNAFLSQQADVMSAVQRMRAQAQADGRLNSNGQETVTTQTQNGQPVIEIAPANPQVVYVPQYDPAYIWGPPAWGYYPPLYYPTFGFGFGPGIFIGSFFGGLGWGGWGWGPNWFGSSIITRPFFFNHYGFGGFRGGFAGGVWAHDPGHRLGIPYPTAGLTSRFAGGAQAGGWRRFGEPGLANGRGFQSNVPGNANRNVAPSVNRGGAAWNRFGGGAAQPSYRSNPAFGGAGTRPYGPSFGANRSVPNNRPSPAFGGSAYRSAPSFNGGGFRGNGGGSAYRAAPSFGGGGFRSGGGGGYHAAPSFGGSGGGFHGSGGGGGGGSHGGGGGGSHGGGGGHRR